MRARTTRCWDLGLYSEGLRTMVLPQIRGQAIALAVRFILGPRQYKPSNLKSFNEVHISCERQGAGLPAHSTAQ